MDHLYAKDEYEQNDQEQVLQEFSALIAQDSKH